VYTQQQRNVISPRVVREIIGLALMILGAAATVVSVAVWWHPMAGLFLAGVYLLGAGWFLASATIGE